jgi:hypothetical protein
MVPQRFGTSLTENRMGTRVIAFDCQIGLGKGSWRRTVIAVESKAYSSTVPFNPDMTVDTAGKWKILYRPKALTSSHAAGLMPLDELESHLSSFTVNAQ